MLGWLKKSSETHEKIEGSVVEILKKNIGGYVTPRPISNVHASALTKVDPPFCPRQYALFDKHNIQLQKEYIATAQQATFDVGNATAELVRERWLGQAAIGNWECVRCATKHWMTSKPHAIGCTDNRHHVWRYHEPFFISQTHGFRGSIDVFVNLGKYVATELKIMKGEDFDALAAPLPEHRLRTALYLKLIEDSDSHHKHKIDLTEARVVYVSRAYGKKQPLHGDVILPFKEFKIKRDDEGLKQVLRKATQIKLYREDPAKPMPSGICGTALDLAAKKCPVCAHCFSGHHPAQQEPL